MPSAFSYIMSPYGTSNGPLLRFVVAKPLLSIFNILACSIAIPSRSRLSHIPRSTSLACLARARISASLMYQSFKILSKLSFLSGD